MADDAVILRFDEFELTLAPLALWRHGRAVRARAQVLQLLELLASRPGTLVTHGEIRGHLWNGRVVDFARSVHVCVRQLREALGDDAGVPRFVETVPRQGYRFVATVRMIEAPASLCSAPPAVPVAAPAPAIAMRRPTRRLVAGGLACLAVATLALAVVRLHGPKAPEHPSAARDAYLRGRYLLDRGDPGSTDRSVPYFLEALARDARHAPSHVALARAYRLLGRQGDSRRHAQDAIALAPKSADAHVEYAISLMAGGWDWDAAGAHLGRALALDPESADARQAAAARLAILGEFEAANAEMARALALDPASTLLRADYGWMLYLAGDHAGAMARCREALALDPRHFSSLACLARSAEARGELDTAAAAALRMMRLWGATAAEQAEVSGRPPALALRAFHEWRLAFFRAYPDRSAIQPADLADVHAALGEHEAAIGFLERAVDAPTATLPLTIRDPIYAPLRDDARFKALLVRLKLHELIATR